MLPDLLGLAAVVALAAIPFVSRRLRPGHPAQQAGTAAVSPARPSPAAGGMAVPAVTVQPSAVMTEPYAYDNGVKAGGAS